MATTSLKQQYKAVVRQYLQEMCFEVVSPAYDSLMAGLVVKYFQSRGISSSDIQRTMPMIETAVWITETTYPFVPRDVREHIAIYTALVVIIEDMSSEILSHMRDFQIKMLRNETQPDQWLAALVDNMDTLRSFYCPFVGDMIVKATLEFISASRFEAEYNESDPTRAGPEFPYYMRLKSGIGETYACFAFPETSFSERNFLRSYLPVIPDLTRFINLSNDLLSYYKESIVSNEELNYINNHAKSNNVTILESLDETREALVNSITTMRQILATDDHTRNKINQLLNGYIIFHFSAPRYKLAELNILPLEDDIVSASKAIPRSDMILNPSEKLFMNHMLSQVFRLSNKFWKGLSGKGAVDS